MEMTLTDLPRPLFLRDLPALAGRSGFPTVLVLVESRQEAPVEEVERWVRAFPGCRLLVAAADTAMPLVERSECGSMPGVTLVTVRNWGGAEMLEEVVGFLASLHPDLIVTTMPYDAYGTLVKRPIESGILQVMGRCRSLFLAHDPVFGTVRAMDAALVEDRLKRRPRRLGAYRAVARAVLVAARILCRLGGGDGRRAWRRAT